MPDRVETAAGLTLEDPEEIFALYEFDRIGSSLPLLGGVAINAFTNHVRTHNLYAAGGYLAQDDWEEHHKTYLHEVATMIANPAARPGPYLLAIGSDYGYYQHGVALWLPRPQKEAQAN